MYCPDPTGGAVSSGSPYSWPMYCQNTTKPIKMSATVLDNISDQNSLSVTVVDDSEWSYRLAYPIQIRWKADDFHTTVAVSTLTIEDSKTQPTVLASLLGPTSTSQSLSATSSPMTQSSIRTGLSTGSIVAIVVVLGVVVIAAILAFVWWKRWSARHTTAQRLSGDVTSSHIGLATVGFAIKGELEGTTKIREVQGSSSVSQ